MPLCPALSRVTHFRVLYHEVICVCTHPHMCPGALHPMRVGIQCNAIPVHLKNMQMHRCRNGDPRTVHALRQQLRAIRAPTQEPCTLFIKTESDFLEVHSRTTQDTFWVHLSEKPSWSTFGRRLVRDSCRENTDVDQCLMLMSTDVFYLVCPVSRAVDRG